MGPLPVRCVLLLLRIDIAATTIRFSVSADVAIFGFRLPFLFRPQLSRKKKRAQEQCVRCHQMSSKLTKKQRPHSSRSNSVSPWLRKKKKSIAERKARMNAAKAARANRRNRSNRSNSSSSAKGTAASIGSLNDAAPRPSASNHPHTSGGRKGKLKLKKRTTDSDPSGGGNKKKNAKTQTSSSSQGGAGWGEAGAGDEVDTVSAQIASVTRRAVEDLRLGRGDLIHYVFGAVGQEHPLITRDHIVVGVRAYHETKAAAVAIATAASSECTNLNSSAQKLPSKRKRSPWEESSLLSVSSSSSSSSSQQQQRSVGTAISRRPALPVIDITNVRGIPRDDGGERMIVGVPDSNADAAALSVPAAISTTLEANPTAVRRNDHNTIITAGTHTISTRIPTCTSPTKLSLLQTLTKERKERVIEMARYEQLYRTLTQSLDSTLTENATLRQMLRDRDEEQLQFETTLAVHGEALHSRSVDILRHRQSVLLGLHHARHCRVEPPTATTCPVEYCGRYKELLQHNATCTAASCDYPHCRTHRALQQHADRCRNEACWLCQPLREAVRGEREEAAAALAIASMRHRDDGASSALDNGGGGGGGGDDDSSGAAPERPSPVYEGQQQQQPIMVPNAQHQYHHQNHHQHQHHQQQQQMVAEQSKPQLLHPPPAQEQPPPRPMPSQPILVEKPPCAGTQKEDQKGQDQDQQMQQHRQELVEKSPLLQQQRNVETLAAVERPDMPPPPIRRRSVALSPPQEMLGEGPQSPGASPGQKQNLHQEYEQQQEQRRPMRQFLRTLLPAAAAANSTREPENQPQQQGQTPAAVGRSGTPPPLAHSKSSKRRTASPLAPVNPNRPAIPSFAGSSQSKKPSIYSPLHKRRQSFHGSVASSLLSTASRGRRDSDFLSSSRARFAKQLQARDESSTESEAPSSIDTDDSSEQFDSVGVLECKACTESVTSIQLCKDCEKPTLDIFLHASTCQNMECTAIHCGDMKLRLQHLENCEIGFARGCRACRFILPLFRLHARQCQLNQCSVVLCASFKSCANCNENATIGEKKDSVEPKPCLCSICQAILPPALLHSANCTDSACAHPACAEMKEHAAHWMACSEGPNCSPCRRYVSIIRAHAMECQDSSCPIASCATAKASLFRPYLFRPGFFRAPEASPREVWL